MSLAPGLIDEAAALLDAAHTDCRPIGPVTQRYPGMDVADAYAIQQVNLARRLAGGRTLIGHKIGLTSKPMQTLLGVDEPDFGYILDDMVVPDGASVARDRFCAPRVEPEVAFLLGKPLRGPGITVADVRAATEAVAVALEIVDSRIADWKIGIVDTIADNASSGLFVLGNDPRKLETLDLHTSPMVMESNGKLVSSGYGAACLGHPVNAVWWLAKVMVERGRPLLAGDIVLSGALGPIVTAVWNTVVQANIEGIGSVSVAMQED